MAIVISNENIVVGTIAAVLIFACLFVTMGVVIYLYCRGKRRQREQELRAKLILTANPEKKEVKQEGNYLPWTPVTPSEPDGIPNPNAGDSNAGGPLTESTPLITVKTES